MDRNVDEDFQILAYYLAEKKKLPVDSDGEVDEDEKCEQECGGGRIVRVL